MNLRNGHRPRQPRQRGLVDACHEWPHCLSAIIDNNKGRDPHGSNCRYKSNLHIDVNVVEACQIACCPSGGAGGPLLPSFFTAAFWQLPFRQLRRPESPGFRPGAAIQRPENSHTKTYVQHCPLLCRFQIHHGGRHRFTVGNGEAML